MKESVVYQEILQEGITKDEQLGLKKAKIEINCPTIITSRNEFRRSD